MNPKSSNSFLRRVLTGWLERLDQAEKKSVRSKKTSWYNVEYHVPPLLVAVLSTLIFFGLVVWNFNLNLYQYTSVGFFIVLLVVLFAFYLVRDHPDLARSDEATSLIAVLFLISFVWILLFKFVDQQTRYLNIFITPIGMAPFLTVLLLNVRLAVVMSFITALLFGILADFKLDVVLMASIGNIVMVNVGSRTRNATQVARTGFIVGLTQLLVLFFLAILREWSKEYTIGAMINSFFSGILAAFFSLGALPYLENFFSRISNLRLLELTDVNHPLLRRMSLEAPGTYHHSMIVASLAAEAATAIGANSLLCRAGAYFHDIGKMVKADYFIENQGAFGNPHDEVSPSLSKLIITSHVKEGIAIGKAYKLDQQVLEFIPQHHGTSQIEYFYQKAIKLEESEEDEDKEDVKEESYRYPGPKPQTREAGIVMMADSVEAASRTLDEPNHQRYKDLVYKILNKKMFDGQFDETPLTLKDLNQIADSFTSTLSSLHHNRIPYPEGTLSQSEKKKEKLRPAK